MEVEVEVVAPAVEVVAVEVVAVDVVAVAVEARRGPRYWPRYWPRHRLTGGSQRRAHHHAVSGAPGAGGPSLTLPLTLTLTRCVRRWRRD